MSDFLPPVTAVLRAEIGQFSAKMGEARGEMAKTSSEGGAHFQNLSKMGTTALLGIAAAAIGLGAESVHLADTFEISHARLTTAVKNSGASWASWSGDVSNADNSMEKLGFTHAQTENALARLVPVTQTHAQALSDESIAANISAARHIDLETATRYLVQAETGHITRLSQLGVQTKDLTGKTISQQAAIEQLRGLYVGSAASAAETLGGKEKVLEARLSDLGVKVGGVLVPVLGTLVGGVEDVINFFEHGGTAADVLGIAVGTTLVAAFGMLVAIKIKGFLGNVVDLFGGSATAAVGAATATDVQAASSAALTAALEANTVALGGQTVAEQASATAATEAFAAYQAAGAAAAEMAVGEEAATAGMVGMLGPAALAIVAIGGIAYGLTHTAPQWDINAKGVDKLANENMPKLVAEISGLAKVTGDETGMHRTFNQILGESPAKAALFIQAMRDSGEKVGWYTKQLDEHIGKQQGASTAVEIHKAKLALLTQGYSEDTAAILANQQALDKTIDPQLKAADAVVATNRALRDYAANAFASAGGTSANADANDNYSSSVTSAKRAIEAQTTAQLEAGKSYPAVVAGLNAVAATLAPGNPLRVFIEDYITKLNETGGTHTATINANTAPADAALSGLISRMAQNGFTPGSAGVGAGALVPAGTSPHYTMDGKTFLGYYGSGGVVPGPVGAPGWAVVHGGERIETPAQQAGGGSGGGGTTVVLQPVIVGTLSASQSKALARQLADDLDNELHGMHRQGRGGYPPSP